MLEDNSTKQHEDYMRQCIALATVAKERGDSPVGSVIVKDGAVIGTGIEGGKTHKDITYHAEIEAVRDAAKRTGSGDFTGCILYTTHEPCIMCSYVIRHSRISKIVIGLTSGEIGGLSSVYPLLTDTSIAKWGSAPRVIKGILDAECTMLNK